MSEFNPDWVSPPSDTIKRILKERGFNENEFIELYCELESVICNNSKITGTNAELLSNVLGGTKNFWLRRDRTYRQECKRLNKCLVCNGNLL
jgi:HTH-type transcriptional regulator/antitoxin HigA